MVAIRSSGDRAIGFLVRHRYVALTLVAIYFFFRERRFPNGDAGDWWVFVHYSRFFSTDGVHLLGVYLGPLALLLARPFDGLSLGTGWSICSALCMALGVLSLWWIESAAAAADLGEAATRQRAVLVGGVFVLYAWSQPAVVSGHPDDVLALALIVFAARGVARGQWWVAALAVGAAAEAKPWAWLVLPLAAAFAGRRVYGVLVALAVGILPWLPYVLIVQGSLDTHTVDLLVSPLSGPHFFGAAVDSTPAWPRLVQLAIALPVGYYAIVRDRWYLVAALALTTRVSFDPDTLFYYQTGAVIGLFLWDVVRPIRQWPGLRTILGFVLVFLVQRDASDLGLIGSAAEAIVPLLRFAVLSVVVVAVFARSRSLGASTPGPLATSSAS